MNNITDEPCNDDAPPTRDQVDLRITAGTITGLMVSEGGTVYGAFTTSQELCAWLEELLRPLDPTMDHLASMPRVVRERLEETPSRRRGLMAILGGKT